MASHILNETLSLTGRRQRPDWQGSVSDAYYSLNKTGSGQVVGAIRVTSEIAGEILIDGQPTGTTIKADGTEIIANRKTGATEVAVKEPNGTVTKAPTVRVLQGQTVAAVIERPVPANMVRINGGTFTMGSPASEVDRRDNEGPQHRVTVSSFYMGKYEVTQKEYQEVMGTNPSYFKGDNLPVEQVSWFDAVNYCNRLSQKEGLTPAYTINGENITWNQNANGYRLPTEAEWEYACRAETTTRFWSGNDETSLAGKANVADLTAKEKYTDWTIVNIRDGYAETSPVGRFSPNSWGLYDMHGNVWEWCWDWYGDYPSNAQTDPRGASSGSNRVFRGGSWSNYAQILRSAYRDYYTPSSRYYFIGFRVVRP
jgi:formylglycine-generating enzyme required for sulfatase activity